MDLTLEDARRSLARAPAVLRALVTGLPDRWLDANEGEGTFTVRDVLGHLVSGEGDSEGADWIPRFRLILEHGESRSFVAFDRTMFRERWARASAAELLDAFAGVRAESLAHFDSLGLTPADFARTGTHPDFGRVTLGQLLATWVARPHARLADHAGDREAVRRSGRSLARAAPRGPGLIATRAAAARRNTIRPLAACGLLLLGLALLAGCDTFEHLDRLHPRTGAPPVAPEVLAAADTATAWIGDPRPARTEPASIGILVLWDAFDPRSAAVVPMVEAWHEAYARWGLRITGLHFAPYPFAGDSAVVGAAARRLGVRFPTAVVSIPPPAAVTAGRGPVIVWPGGGDAEPQWLQTPGDANAFEMRLRARLRQLHPDAGFPADAGGVARGAVSPGAARTLLLGVDRVARGPLRGAKPGTPQPFVSPFRSEQEGALDTPVPVGWWTPLRDGLEAARGGAANFLAIRYDAGPVGAVMGPPTGESQETGPARIWILQDEHWLAPADAGADVRFDPRGGSYVELDATRAYALTRGGAHVLKLSPDAPGTRLYSFTLEAEVRRP